MNKRRLLKYEDGGTVPYVSLYDPREVEKYSQALGNMQQRYDTSQSALANYLNEYANADIHKNYLTDVDKIVSDRLSKIDKSVSDDYGGDYGIAANDIVKQLALARKPVQQAMQATKSREEASKLYQQGAMSGNINRVYDPIQKKFITPSFDEIAGSDRIFTDEGKFVGAPDYMGRFRGAGDHDKFIKENFSNTLDNVMRSVRPDIYQNKVGNFLTEGKIRSYDDKEIDALLWDDKSRGIMSDVGKSYLNSFAGGSKFATEEFQNATPEQMLDYIGDTIKSQTAKSKMTDFQYLRPGKNQGQQEDTDLRAQIFSPKTQTRFEENPYVTETGSYQKILNPGYFGRNQLMNLIIPKDGVKDINKSISDLESSIKESGQAIDPVSKSLIDDNKKLLEKLKTVRDDFNYASESIKNSMSVKEFGVEFNKASEDQKKIIKSKMPKDDMELAKLIDADNTLLTQSSSNSATILHPTTQKKIKEVLLNNIENANFSGSRKSASSYFNDVMEDLDVDDPQYVRDYISKNNVIPSYNSSRGEYYIDVPTSFGSKGVPDKSDPKYKRLYFTIGSENEGSRNVLKSMTSAISSKSKDFVVATDGFKYNFRYNPKKSTFGSDKTEKKVELFDLNNNPVFDESGNVLTISLQELQDMMESYQTIHLAEKLTKPFMTLSDQKKDPTFTEYEE